MSDTFAELASALYGERWQAPLARDLNLNLRTVQRWAAGTEPPDAILAEMIAKLREKVQRDGELLKRISR